MAQVLHVRSRNAMQVQLALGLFAWATGASRQLLEVLHRCSLSPSYTTLLEVMRSVADEAVEEGRTAVEEGPTGLAYDNFNASHSNHVEQRPDAPNKVISGTFPVIYKLHNANFNNMLLQPLLDNLAKAGDLTIGDITPTSDQIGSYHTQKVIHIVQALCRNLQSFASYEKHPLLQHKPRRPLPRDLQTQYYPLRINTIEEASINGNLLVQEDTVVHQLKQAPEKNNRLTTHLWPTFADLLTLLRIRSCLLRRMGDINAWERREIIAWALGIGLFHLVMNLIWMINTKHASSVREIGTLHYWFSQLQKVRLTCKKPDFHALLTTLEQILDGILLYAWNLECGYANLQQFASSKPSPEVLLDIARRILNKYA